MTDMKSAEHYFDIEISQQQHLDKITLMQSAFIIEILEHFEMKNSKSVSTFMKTEAQLNLDVINKLLKNEEKKQYQQEVRSLIYLMLETRSDITFAVEILSRFTVYLQIKHVKALNQVFCYLNETIHISIIYSCCERRLQINL